MISNLYVRVPTALSTDARVLAAGPAAFGLHVAAWLYCGHHLTDGSLPRSALRAVLPCASLRIIYPLISRLESAGLWLPTEQGWTIVGFADHNFTRFEIEQRARQNSENGKLGGRPRSTSGDSLNKNTTLESGEQTRALLSTKARLKASPKPYKTTQLEQHDIKRSSDDDRDLSQEFIRLWSVYPRKVAKQAAWNAFQALRPDSALVEVLLTAVRRQITSQAWQQDGGKFIPHAASWLRGRRWEDDASPGERTERTAAEEARNGELLQRRAVLLRGGVA